MDLDKKLSLIIKLRNKTITPSERGELISSYLPLATEIVRRFMRSRVNNRDEVTASIYYELVRAVDRASDRLVDNDLESYLAETLSKRCRDAYLKAARTFGVPPSSYRKGITARHSTRSSIDQFDQLEARPPEDFFDVEDRDFVDAVTVGPIEKQIIRMRIAGYTQEEIGAAFDKSREMIGKICRRVESRLTENLKKCA